MYLRYQDPNNNAIRDFAIRKPILSIGRSQGNDIVFADPSISKTHANIFRKPKCLTIALLDRSDELYVNGQRVRKADIKPGDVILVGLYEITVHEGEPKAQATSADIPSELKIDALERLVCFSTTLMEESKPKDLFVALLKEVVALTKAKKGFIIVVNGASPAIAASHNIESKAAGLEQISDSIIEKVIQTREPLIISDALKDKRFSSAKSVVDMRLSSVMCVPLIHRSSLLGVIYVGNDKISALFDEGTLALLQVFASQASLLVHTALLLNELKLDNKNLRDQLKNAAQGNIIGASTPMKSVFKVLRRIAPTDLTVLVTGETGTGKELVAHELHRLSQRSSSPFISINCGAIPDNLLESELFGHKKGSFTGATSDKVGKFEAANGGTLFLDEIAEMPHQLQVKLLRVIQDRVVERVGDLKGKQVDIRIVAATNKDLNVEVEEGRFRQDLMYRLNVVSIELPPLRDRGDDVLQIAQYFMAKYSTKYSSKVRGFSKQCITAMNGYFWPGNIRQLENRVKKAVIMSDAALLTPKDMDLSNSDKRHIQPLAVAEEEFKLDYIRKVLDMNNWNKAQTARDLDVDPRTIFRYIERFEE